MVPLPELVYCVVILDLFSRLSTPYAWNVTKGYDGMPIGTEIEVLKLIERWNANADQRKEEIVYSLTL
eukprot:323591-Amphidinium_carterae.1